MKIKDEFSVSSMFDMFLTSFKGMVIEYELNEKRRKSDALLKSMLEIIDELSEEEESFKKVDKRKLFEYLSSRLHLLPYDITKDELYKRLTKIMAIEAMSRILDGLSPGEVKELERSFK